MWQWSRVQATEATAPVTVWPRLRKAPKHQSASEAGPKIWRLKMRQNDGIDAQNEYRSLL